MIICLGAFDGYHRGHFELFRTAGILASKQHTSWEIVTFEPHPRFVLGGLEARLFSREETEILRRSFNISEPIEIPFTLDFAATEPADFLNRLGRSVSVSGLVVGESFRFGKNRSGDAAFLKDYCRENGIELRLIPQQNLDDGTVISSTRVRDMVQAGSVERAAQLLGYPWFVISEIVHGEQRGRAMGYPTANMVPDSKKLIPGEGVYAGAMYHLGQWFPAAISVGRNPTFLVRGTQRIEAHVLGWEGDLYGKKPLLTFFRRLRLMTRYNGPDELMRQLARDCAQTVKCFDEFLPMRQRLTRLPITL